MAKKMGNLKRGKSLIKFISEGEGHTLEEASKKFQLSKADIRADLNCVRYAAFNGYIENYKEWQQKYIFMNKILSSLEKKRPK